MTEIKTVACPSCGGVLCEYLDHDGKSLMVWVRCSKKGCLHKVQLMFTKSGVRIGSIDAGRHLIAQSHKLVTRRPKSLA